MVKPWLTEPNTKDWEAHGLPCALRRGPGGHWCGYVGVSAEHPAHMKEYWDLDVRIHGGLTYGEPGNGKHLPEGRYWLGFDCAHSGDLCPWYADKGYHSFADGEYRDIHYVTAETERLAEQLAVMVEGQADAP